MGKKVLTGLILLISTFSFSQVSGLPPDFRQHNLMEFNSHVFNPAFSLRQTSENQVALWTRWQWQGIDADPTTLFLSYQRKIELAAFGASFFQHNTGFFKQTGGLLNFSYDILLGDDVNLGFGINLIGFQQRLADDAVINDPPLFPFEQDATSFIMRMAPGVELRLGQLGLGVTAEDLFDYDFNQNEPLTESDGKTFNMSARYSFQIAERPSGKSTYLQPFAYYRRLPGYDNQLGINLLWSAPSYWAQVGYNNFYGVSVGLGVNLFQKASLGGLVEVGSDDNVLENGTSYEFLAAYSFGEKKPEEPEELEEELIVEEELGDPEQAVIAAEIEAQQRSLEEAARQQELAMERRRDSIRESEEIALAMQRRQDSIREAEQAAVALSEKVVPEKGEKYQEVNREEGLQPGFYLIANVFGTKKYYDKFMQQLADEGLEPKSFYRAANKYNYVYLKRYNTIDEARRARDSQFDGKYRGDLWVFRIR